MPYGKEICLMLVTLASKLENVLDDSFKILLDLLNSFESTNNTDPVGLLLLLFTCVGHFSGNSRVKITNHIANLNIFLLLIGPSSMATRLNNFI